MHCITHGCLRDCVMGMWAVMGDELPVKSRVLEMYGFRRFRRLEESIRVEILAILLHYGRATQQGILEKPKPGKPSTAPITRERAEPCLSHVRYLPWDPPQAIRRG